MSGKESKWHKGPMPEDLNDLEGGVVLVVLHRENMRERGAEYYGKPVAAIYHLYKLKTTLGAVRLETTDVVRWRRL